MICSLICAAVLSFFSTYPDDCRGALRSFEAASSVIDSNLSRLSPTEKTMALAIVAPELSQFSQVTDFVELQSLYVMYVNAGTADFSVGPFQMKPSFVETLESVVKSTPSLKKQYSALLPEGTVREQRRARLDRLSTLSGQLQYLELFIEVVKIKTAGIRFAGDEERLKHWATLYNSGINLTPAKVRTYQAKKLFPRARKQFNYADVALEFYRQLSR